MNPIFNYSQIPSFSFDKIKIFNFLTNQQKKIIGIVLLALGYLALCYTLFQKFNFYRKITFKPPQPILSQQEIALKELEKGINLPLVKKLELAKQVGSSLTQLDFFQSEVTDTELIEVFKACPKLEFLNVAFCKNVTGQFLYHLPQDLKILMIGGCDLTTINFKSLSKDLEDLYLSGCKNLTDDILIDFLSNSPQHLHTLEIFDCSLLTEAFLPKLSNNLRSLSVSGLKNLSTESLKHLPPQLRSLHFIGCDQVNVSFNHSLSLKNLKDLNLACCDLANTSFDELPIHLESLNLSCCKNLKKEHLQHLKNLKSLNLTNCRLTNEILNQLSPSIECVNLSQCNLKDVDLDQLPPHLFTMTITGCDLKAEIRARKWLAKALSSKVIKDYYEQAKLTPHLDYGTKEDWSIKFSPNLKSYSACDIYRREICLHADLTDSQAICFFILELPNAINSLKVHQNTQKMRKGEIECEEYVLTAERIQFEGKIVADKALKAVVEEMGWDHSLFSYFHHENLPFERYWHQIRFGKQAQNYRNWVKDIGKPVKDLGFKDRLVSVGYLLSYLSFKDLTKIIAIGVSSGYLMTALATSILGMTATIYSIGILTLAGCIGAIARRCLYPFNLSEDLQLIFDYSLSVLSSLSLCIPALRAPALAINAFAVGNIFAHIWNL